MAALDARQTACMAGSVGGVGGAEDGREQIELPQTKSLTLGAYFFIHFAGNARARRGRLLALSARRQQCCQLPQNEWQLCIIGRRPHMVRFDFINAKGE